MLKSYFLISSGNEGLNRQQQDPKRHNIEEEQDNQQQVMSASCKTIVGEDDVIEKRREFSITADSPVNS